MRISELPNLVVGVKKQLFPEFASPSTIHGWLGFTPARDNTASRAKLRSTVTRQMGAGYVMEYIPLTRPAPKLGSPPLTEDEKELHAKSAGALTAVFKLASRPVHAIKVVGRENYDGLQRRWDRNGAGTRWSEAFPILEAWQIEGWPKARDVLGPEAAGRLCEIQSRVLTILHDSDRQKVADLEISPIDLPATGLAAQHFIDLEMKTNSDQNRPPEALSSEARQLYADYTAIEGITKEARTRYALRDRHLARELKRIGPLICALCAYDPLTRGAEPRRASSMLDAHHRTPISAGVRLSRREDLVLLCPTCHREVHQGIGGLAPE